MYNLGPLLVNVCDAYVFFECECDCLPNTFMTMLLNIRGFDSGEIAIETWMLIVIVYGKVTITAGDNYEANWHLCLKWYLLLKLDAI